MNMKDVIIVMKMKAVVKNHPLIKYLIP